MFEKYVLFLPDMSSEGRFCGKSGDKYEMAEKMGIFDFIYGNRPGVSRFCGQMAGLCGSAE